MEGNEVPPRRVGLLLEGEWVFPESFIVIYLEDEAIKSHSKMKDKNAIEIMAFTIETLEAVTDLARVWYESIAEELSDT